jgi:glyoxylase-like metal-dependent hydrolase (beta-lactamase superfamily II)
MKRVLFPFALLLLTLSPALAQDFSQVEIKTHALRDGIYMLEGFGGNIGVSIGEDGVFLVDDQFAPLNDKILTAIAKLSDRPVGFVLNTHWHGDHTGGNEPLGKAGALLVAHDNVYQRMSTEQVSELLGRTTPPSPEDALPVLTFDSSVTFRLNGETIRAHHVPPAHTDGDSIVRFEGANAVHLGDLFFNGVYPFIDISSGGDVDGYLAALDQALEGLDDETLIIPGHGPLAKKADLVAARDMLRTVRDRIAAAIAEGKSVEETLAASPTAEFDEKWSWEFISGEQLVRIVYAGLSGS